MSRAGWPKSPTSSLGEERGAARLYCLLLPFAGLYTVAPIEAAFGSVACLLGGLASALGRDDEAVSHLEAAVDLERRMRARPWLARAEQRLATALLGRGRPLDRS